MASRGVQASSSSSYPATYQVFLSFMVEEIGTRFADHLYTALIQAGFRTFRGDNDLEMGENINSQLQKAIQESKISIIVFSKGYASSIRCLDELVMILQHKNTCSVRYQVLPVFYDVDPSDVRKQMGCFEKAFNRHQQKLKTEEGEKKHEWKTKIEGWKDALTEAASIAGMDLKNQADGHESKFIQKIVNFVNDKQGYTALNFDTCLVGIHSRVRSIEKWLKVESSDIGMLAICGMGGSGKTTIARFVYDSNFLRYERRIFLANIAEMSKQPNGIISIQRQLLEDIKGREERVNNIYEGISKIKNALQCRRILLVLDDIDAIDQLEAIVGVRNWLHPGSKIIITTRYEQLIRAHNVKVYKTQMLNFEESLELFSWHAFKQNYPNEEYEEISKRVIAHCGGLPLAIKILSFALVGRSKDVWKSQLEKLETIPDNQILAKLKISYDYLDYCDKEIFLHIACFFVGKDADYVVSILDGCDLHAKVGLQNLIDRYLLTIEECVDWKTRRKRKELKMHNLIQKMGRDIVRQESPQELGRRSRIWDHNSSSYILREKIGTNQIEGLIYNINIFSRADYGGSKPFLYRTLNPLKKFALNIFPSYLIGVNSRNSNEESLKTDAFTKMHNLKLLQLNYVQLSGSYERFPKRLRWLCWRGFPLPSIPNDFLLERLVILEMLESNLKNVWNGTKNLQCLKILDVSSSKSLTCTPNFSFVTRLEILLLENCTSLVEIHESIGLLKRLDFLNLRNCSSLSYLPRSIGRLRSLKTLDISGCSNLEELPTEMMNMKSLKELHANGMVKLWNPYLEPRQSSKFSCRSFPQFLVYLSLKHCCLSDESFPSNRGNFMSLEELNLSKNPICGLPECFKGLPRLHSVNLAYCRNLRSITGLQKFKNLRIRGCELVLGIKDFCEYQLYDGFVDVIGCDNLNEIEGLFKIEELSKVNLKIINNLGLLNFRETNIALRLLKTHAYSRGKKFFCPQVCHSPVFQYISLSKMEMGDYNCTTTKQFQESCVFMTYICGSKIPSWFNFKNKGFYISFIVPPNIDIRIQGLTLCFVYIWFLELTYTRPIEINISVTNKTKKKMWRTQAWTIGLQETEEDEDIMMLNYWKLEGDELTAGDELVISAEIMNSYFTSIVKEIGVRLLYEDKERKEKSKQSNSEEEEEETQQICAYEKVCDIDQHVSIDSRTKLYLPIHLENRKLKLISNGCPTLNHHPYGGVIVDEKDMWMTGYYGHFNYTRGPANYILISKLRGIFEGLKIMCQRGWTQVEVAVDSLDFLHLLHGNITFEEYFHRLPELHRKPYVGDKLRKELEFIRYILKRSKCTLSHTPLNQWNQVALQLANMALNQGKPRFVVLEHPPVELGLECLLKECAEIGEETRVGHPPPSRKVIVKSRSPRCTRLDLVRVQKPTFCKYCKKVYCTGGRYRYI